MITATRSDHTDREALGDPLVVERLTIGYRQPDGRIHPVVRDVSFTLAAGDTLAILGESGSGKTSVASAVMDLLPASAHILDGRIRIGEVDLLAGSPPQRRQLRVGRLAMVFQDPMTALNPVHTVGRQIAEPLRRHRGMSRAQARAETIRLLERVRIPSPQARIRSYPHQLSGGMRQRVMIAIALAMRPAYLVADEPTTALDVRVQAEILALLRQLQVEEEMGLVIIGHDLAVLAQTARRVAVMYGGRVVEEGPLHDVYREPRHPYTKGLLEALPATAGERLRPIPGSPPAPDDMPAGCAFHPRCPMAIDICRTQRPELALLYAVDGGPPRRSACHRSSELAHA